MHSEMNATETDNVSLMFIHVPNLMNSVLLYLGCSICFLGLVASGEVDVAAFGTLPLRCVGDSAASVQPMNITVNQR